MDVRKLRIINGLDKRWCELEEDPHFGLQIPNGIKLLVAFVLVEGGKGMQPNSHAHT